MIGNEDVARERRVEGIPWEAKVMVCCSSLLRVRHEVIEA